MSTPATAFALPITSPSKSLHVMRRRPAITRGELVDATGLSQPTVTRAVTALIDAGLARQRDDLTRSQGRGRPTVPLEIADNTSMYGGIAVGTKHTYIALFDLRGRTLADVLLPLDAATLDGDDFIEHIMAGLNRLAARVPRTLRAVGATFPGHISSSGRVTAPSLNWFETDIAGRLAYQFSVPVTIAAAVPAILGSELQSNDFTSARHLALFADDSLGAAVTTADGITQLDLDLPEDSILPTAGLRAVADFTTVAEAAKNPSLRPLLDDRARQLGSLAATLIRENEPETVVVAGSTFIDDPLAARTFARTVRDEIDGQHVNLRLIPSHDEVIRAISCAAALDQVLQNPLVVP